MRTYLTLLTFIFTWFVALPVYAQEILDNPDNRTIVPPFVGDADLMDEQVELMQERQDAREEFIDENEDEIEEAIEERTEYYEELQDENLDIQEERIDDLSDNDNLDNDNLDSTDNSNLYYRQNYEEPAFYTPEVIEISTNVPAPPANSLTMPGQ
jgi:hypothetical protein